MSKQLAGGEPPEIIPPDSKEPIAVGSSQTRAIVRKAVIGVSAVFLFSVVLWCLNQFLSLRGVVNVVASRIVLGFMWLAGAVLVLLGAKTLPFIKRRKLVAILGSLFWILGVGALDWWAPKPPPLAADAKTSSTPTPIAKLATPTPTTTPVVSSTPGLTPRRVTPFSIVSGTAIVSDFREAWAFGIAPWTEGNVLHPIHFAHCLTITNIKSTPTMISALSVDVLGNDKKWILMRKIPYDSGPIYAPVKNTLGANLVPLKDGFLFDSITNRSFGPGESARGWIIYGAPENYNSFPKPLRFRIRIKDMAGDEVIREIIHPNNPTEHKTQVCSVTGIPTTVNLHEYKIRIYGDPQ
jgi:hypothetical protein